MVLGGMDRGRGGREGDIRPQNGPPTLQALGYSTHAKGAQPLSSASSIPPCAFGFPMEIPIDFPSSVVPPPSLLGWVGRAHLGCEQSTAFPTSSLK